MTAGEPFRPPRSPRPFAEFSLAFLIARSARGAAEGGTRLDAFEEILGRLVRRWHPGRPLSPARDIRMATSTLEELFEWVSAGEVSDAVAARFGVYHSGAVTDPMVPRGWVRVYLGAEREGPAELRASRG